MSLLTEYEKAIAILNRAAANAYTRDGNDSLYGWAYSTAATRLYAAAVGGEEIENEQN